MFKRISFGYHLVIIAVATLVFTNNANAALTLEQIQQVLQKKAIPIWQNAATKIKYLIKNPPNSKAAETWKELDAETDITTGKAPLARATMAKDGNDLFLIATWLRWRILSENADPRYSYAYAADLHYMRDERGDFHKDAAIFFYNAKLGLDIDGARCADKASPQSIALGFETQKYVQPLIENIAKMSKLDKASAILEAVAIEEMRGERPLLEAFCTSGANSMLKAISAGSKPEKIKSSDSKIPGDTYSIDVSKVKPQVIPDIEWQKKRREILDGYVKSAIELL